MNALRVSANADGVVADIFSKVNLIPVGGGNSYLLQARLTMTGIANGAKIRFTANVGAGVADGSIRAIISAHHPSPAVDDVQWLFSADAQQDGTPIISGTMHTQRSTALKAGYRYTVDVAGHFLMASSPPDCYLRLGAEAEPGQSYTFSQPSCITIGQMSGSGLQGQWA